MKSPDWINEWPEGWRFYTVDASIEGKYRLTLSRNDACIKWWLRLPEEQRDRHPLYVTVTERTLAEAIKNAVEKAIALNEMDEMVDTIDYGETYGMRVVI